MNRDMKAGDWKQSTVKQQSDEPTDDNSGLDAKRDSAGEIQEADGVTGEETPVKRVESTNDDYRMHSSRTRVSE